MPNNFVGPHPDQPKTPRLPVLRPLFFRPIAVLALWIAAASTVWAGQAIPSLALQPGLDDILQYIASGWETLTRSMNECKSVVDPKAAGPSILYLPAGFAKPVTVAQMQRNCRVEARPLPVRITHLGQAKVEQIKPSGLLYLPHPYVVPGGRFNEMYGWDSYFILRGLLAASKLDLARGTVENFFFEIENYGWVLNANRSYYLTRSQPPFLSSMVMAIYDAEKDAGRDDREWLARAYPYVARDYQLWVNPPHLADGTGLSRYFDFGDGPVPESFGEGYYRHVAAYFLNHPELAKGEIAGVDGTSASDLSGPVLSLILCQSPEAMRARRPSAAEFGGTGCDTVRRMSLTKDYYKGDRSMRESGFDMSFRFSPFGGRTHHYAAVGLNSLLFKVETDLERMAATLGRPREAHDWHDRAEARRTAVNRYLWDPGRGLYFDYDFDKRARSGYVFATTFYPLWVGLASPEQAAAVQRNLKLLERPGGLATSTENTGGQWDYPYGWAPLQLIAVEGLRRYGYSRDADRLSTEFLSTVLRNFRRDETIREKYDVTTRSSETKVSGGYTENVIGFGWTNAAFVVLLHDLSREDRARLGDE